jgi:uncharacterized glyoxalase superfamily protein PhnB
MKHRSPLAFEDVTPILSVIDLEHALAWYEAVLGFERAWTWGTPMTLASVCRGKVELNLGLRGQTGPPGPGQVYLHVSPVDEVWERVVAAGAEVKEPIADRAYGMRDFALRDESGNVLDFGAPIAVAQPADHKAPAADAVKVFVPARDFALSKRFYAALGFARNWESEGLAELELAGCKLLLQDFYVPDWAGNFMIHVEVPDADAWDRHARAALASGGFANARVEGPRTEPWGYRVSYVHDPSGVLLRFSQPLARPASEG